MPWSNPPCVMRGDLRGSDGRSALAAKASGTGPARVARSVPRLRGRDQERLSKHSYLDKYACSSSLRNRKRGRIVVGLAVGIDLGTTYSAIAAVGRNGKPEILPNRHGERITPSVVFFDADVARVGTVAKHAAITAPLDVVEFVKRHMGNPDWRFETTDGESFTAEAVSAIILKRLKEDAELRFGQGKIIDAVITVPAFFDDARRRATNAGQIAGLNVLRVLNEPTRSLGGWPRSRIARHDHGIRPRWRNVRRYDHEGRRRSI